MLSNQKVKRDPIVEEWLKEFLKDSTRASYRSALNKYKTLLAISSFKTYLQSNPDTFSDIRKFLKILNGKPPKTVKTYCGAVKVFLEDKGYKINEEDWRKLTRRGYMPRRVRAITQDKKPTKEMLKQILIHSNIKGRAMVLFLVSSGARIGETLQLKKQDLDLDSDPPRARIRAEYTKAGVGARTVYFSYEARDAIKEWFKVKDTMKKTTGESYSGNKVFPWNSHTARFMFYLACTKAGIDSRDTTTNRRKIHLHSLRKFFRTKIRLEDLDITNALMGHAEYLDDSYLRLDEEGEIAQSYLGAMANVSVYQIEELEVSKAVEPLKAELEYLKKRNNQILKDNGDLKKRYGRLESMYEATAILCKQFDRKELEKTIKEIYQTVKAEA